MSIDLYYFLIFSSIIGSNLENANECVDLDFKGKIFNPRTTQKRTRLWMDKMTLDETSTHPHYTVASAVLPPQPMGHEQIVNFQHGS